MMMKEGTDMKTFTTPQLVEQLYANLRVLAPQDAVNAYIAGYLSHCLADIATKGVDELAAIVDFTNQQVEVLEYNRRAYDRRQEWVDKEFA
jgi:hypothetical protein